MKLDLKHNIKELFLKNKITSVSFDSRKVKNNDAFFAIKGELSDGNDYIEDALQKGARLVFTDDLSKKDGTKDGDNIVYVEDARLALACAAGLLYPILPKYLIGVTGTNGKSSVVSYVRQILQLLKIPSASIGTLGIESTKKIANSVNDDKFAHLTTSDPINFRKNLYMLKQAGVEYVAFEASSHGLCQKRLAGIKVNSAAFISFSQDHLEYHDTMENYLKAKLILFTDNLIDGGEALINSEIQFFDFIKNFLDQHNVRYSTVGKNGDLEIKQNNQSIEGQEIQCSFNGKDYVFTTNIIGSFQATNLLMAAKLVYNLGIDFDTIVKVLPQINAVPGRLQRVTENDSKYQIFIDYAHTPDALEKSLTELKKLKSKAGNLYVVFGCGGDRDPSKRPIMGSIASKIADHVIITDDNPRTEDSDKIRREIAFGATLAEEIANRKLAIINTIARLKINDILLIAGKGHEDYQIIGDKVIKFNDAEIAYKAMRKNI